MTRKTWRNNKSQGADLEAQPEDEGVQITTCLVLPTHPVYKEVRWKATREMRTLTSGLGREGEVPGATGSGALVGAAESEALAGPSTWSQAQATKDGFSNSGEHSTIS